MSYFGRAPPSGDRDRIELSGDSSGPAVSDERALVDEDLISSVGNGSTPTRVTAGPNDLTASKLAL